MKCDSGSNLSTTDIDSHVDRHGLLCLWLNDERLREWMLHLSKVRLSREKGEWSQPRSDKRYVVVVIIVLVTAPLSIGSLKAVTTRRATVQASVQATELLLGTTQFLVPVQKTHWHCGFKKMRQWYCIVLYEHDIHVLNYLNIVLLPFEQYSAPRKCSI